MKLAAVLIAAVLLGVIALAMQAPGGARDGAIITEPAPVGFDASQPLEDRVWELERALSEERQARQVLEEELVYVLGQLDRLSGRPGDFPAAVPADAANEAEQQADMQARQEQLMARRNSFEGRHERLIDAGLAPARAEWILRRESRFQLDMLRLRHEAERSGDFGNFREGRDAAAAAFREELGPADYERYLEGSGRPTSINVNSVMDASPAQTAGLRPGDEIRRYAGQRVYDMRDLNRLTLEGTPGETVYIDIVRDGIPMQVAVPRGPVGIAGGGRRR